MGSTLHYDAATQPRRTNAAWRARERCCVSPSRGLPAIDVPIYPTRSLDFLEAVKKPNGVSYHMKGTPAAVRLRVLVVGAGLGGLATAIALARNGHDVEVLEQARQLGEVGAGIQVPPNSSRILLEWGLGELLGDRVVEPDGITFRRWESGEAIGYTKLVPDFRVRYRAPYHVVHRAHLHEALHKLALQLGVAIRLQARVASYNNADGSVTLSNGTITDADLVVAADGLKSSARSCIPGEESTKPQYHGFAAYRATVDVEKMQSDPEISWLLDKPALNIWIGDGSHVMTYTIASGKSFNMVLSHTDRTDPATWQSSDLVQDMRKHFHTWDPRLVKIIDKTDHTLKWPLMTVPIMRRWVSESSKLVVLGDAAHAMVPYMSQGAAMAVEDGAALAEALSFALTRDDIPRLLNRLEAVRVARSGQMQQASLINGKLWHFPDGLEQQARDSAMRPEVLGLPFDQSPNQWSDPMTQQWAYGYDAVEAVRRAIREDRRAY